MIRQTRDATMCRNIKTLFNFAPPATEEESRTSALAIADFKRLNR
jgi:hypothetical protein